MGFSSDWLEGIDSCLDRWQSSVIATICSNCHLDDGLFIVDHLIGCWRREYCVLRAVNAP